MLGGMVVSGDTLLQTIKEIWEDIKWWVFVYDYEEAVITRKGHFHRLIKPGKFRWKIPFVEDVFKVITVPTTYDLKPQTLVTKDKKTITVRGMIKAQISDSVVYSTKVFDQKDALGDTTMGVIARIVMDSTFEQLTSSEINNTITVKARVQAKKYGIEVIQVTLVDISESRAYRLHTDSKAELDN